MTSRNNSNFIASQSLALRTNPLIRTLAPIWDNPTHVLVDNKNIQLVAEQLATEEWAVPAWREPVFPIQDDETFIDFLGVGNAINFAFTAFDTGKSFSVAYRDVTWSGAFAMWACLRRGLDAVPHILQGKYLANLSQRELETLFAGITPMPLIQSRLDILRETGSVLAANYDGHFHNLFRAANFAAFGGNGIVDRLLKEFASFRDEGIHELTGSVLQFGKRAQLMAMMYAGRSLTSGTLPRLSDADALGPIADYSVPRALHSLGILRYVSSLENKIRNGELLERDSLEEQEIRAQAVQAQLMMLDELNNRHSAGITTLALDYKLWSLGRKATERHHLTTTTAY
jgi:hypothetical protein